MNNKRIIVIILVLIIIAISIAIILYLSGNKCMPCESSLQQIEKMNQSNKIPTAALYESPGLIQSYNPTDTIREYDYRRMVDPLEEPVRRVPRHELPPLYFKRSIDFPTRGYPDNFTQIGILVKEGNMKDNDNKVLRLFGRQVYPGSDQYEYYTGVNSGNDIIKIPISVKRREIYDDDTVYIKEMKEHYRVHLHKYDAPKYYPDIIY